MVSILQSHNLNRVDGSDAFEEALAFNLFQSIPRWLPYYPLDHGFLSHLRVTDSQPSANSWGSLSKLYLLLTPIKMNHIICLRAHFVYIYKPIPLTPS